MGGVWQAATGRGHSLLRPLPGKEAVPPAGLPSQQQRPALSRRDKAGRWPHWPLHSAPSGELVIWRDPPQEPNNSVTTEI